MYITQRYYEVPGSRFRVPTGSSKGNHYFNINCVLIIYIYICVMDA